MCNGLCEKEFHKTCMNIGDSEEENNILVEIIKKNCSSATANLGFQKSSKIIKSGEI